MSRLPKQFIDFGGKTNGRDKLCRHGQHQNTHIARFSYDLVSHHDELRPIALYRMTQYTAKAVADALNRVDEKTHQDVIKRLKKFEGNISTARKLFRLGKSLEMFYSAKQALHIRDLILQACVVTSRIASAFFLFLDHIIWLHRVKAIQRDIQPVVTLSNQMWLLSIISNLIRNFYDWHRIYKNSQIQQPTNRVGASKEEFVPPFMPTLLDTVRNSLDILIPMNSLKYLEVPGVIQGSAGAVSSIIGMVTIWNDHLKLINM